MARSVLAWRWRRNPLRRRSDVFEAWAGLTTACVIALGAPAAGWAAGATVGSTLRETVRAEHAQRTQRPAVVLRAGPREVSDSDPETGQVREERRLAVVRWTADDGRSHTANVLISADRGKGDRISLWTDRAGRAPAPAPLDPGTADTHATLAGIGTFLAACVLGLMARQSLMWHLMRRRLAEWEREWAAAGQSWGRAGAGG
ncbi:hypothetical protein [Streptomyces sp. MI02-7b]|uniref:Rv1733c family protein n=1 Tax=Streptomyces sp. MI02-7b TaxID=462941 RepID=UPI0029B8FEDD|nr:hypothetical protein [Streptomyces sp. MI02-7b]MDX3077075.1 hypothetical protein [Streptomyces sp. MI02-7b]